MTVKRPHMTEADPPRKDGQATGGGPGKREQKKGKPTGTSGGSPTPTPVRHPSISKVLPDDAHTHGRPQSDDPVFRKVGPARHTTENRANKKYDNPISRTTGSGTSHLTTQLGKDGHAKTVKIRIGKKGSSHRMRMEGQVLHQSGLKVGGGSNQKPFANTGKQLKQPGRPQIAAGAKISDHTATQGLGDTLANSGRHSYGKTTQPRVGKYGTAERFRRLRMTPKTSGGGAS